MMLIIAYQLGINRVINSQSFAFPTSGQANLLPLIVINQTLIIQINMAEVKLQRALEAAQPMLLLIERISVTLPKTTYALYYQNYTQQHQQPHFQNIEHLQELFLPHQHLTFKVINFEARTPPTLIHSHLFHINNNTVTIEASMQEHSIRLEGRILNRSQSEGGVVDLCLSAKEGYDDFYKSRKKYKTLENITKRIQFKIDHRVRLKTQLKDYRFDLQEHKQEHYYLSLTAFQHPLTFILQEITSIEDYSQNEVVDEAEVDLQELTQLDYSYTATVTFSKLLTLHFLFDVVRNHNLATAEMVSIRVLQSSAPSQQLRIGNEHTINLNSTLILKPLLDNRYYDFEWGYLNQNLNKIQDNQQIYSYLHKITKSKNQYPHFLNQEILDLRDSTHLVFQLDGTSLSIPLVYVIEGLNCIQHQSLSLKFYIDSVTGRNEEDQEYVADHKRTYEMCINSVINLGKLNGILDREGSDAFTLKIINQDTSYLIPFQRNTAKKSEFKREVKQLANKQELHILNGNTHYWLQPAKQQDQLSLISTTNILPFYLIHLTSSAPLSLQITINNRIHLEGSLPKHTIVSSQGKPFIHLMTMLEGNSRVGLSLSFVQIKQINQSVATFYRFRHRLCFAEPGESQDLTYDIELQFEKQLKTKSLRAKVSPEAMGQRKAGMLREFKDSSGVLCKQPHLNCSLKLRKMFYNQQLNYFDNQVVKEKSIAINPSADVIKEKKDVMVRLDNQCYEGIEIDFYDDNAKKRVKYYLEIYADKNQFLDHKDSSYRIKIPEVLWQYSSDCSDPQTSNYQIITYLNRKNKNNDKKSIPHNYQQQFILNHYNYNDGISVTKDQKDISYSKLIRCIKLRCDVVKNKIGWSPQSDWYLAVMTLASSNFYFMVQRMFDPNQHKARSSSNQSKKTSKREDSQRSDKHKIDPLAKTISNMSLYKLKKKKNEIQAEGRQLTTRYVKRQEKIIEISKKIEQLEEKTRQKEQEEKEKKTKIKEVPAEDNKMKEFYRSICECGARHPEFKGYCQDCLKKLKQRYQVICKAYKEKCYQYETMVFQEYNQKQKVERMKRKVEALKNREVVIDEDQQGTTADYLMTNIEEKHLKKALEELKVSVFELDQEKSSLLQNSNWQMQALEQKISQQDSEIYKLSQEYDSLKNKLAELTQLINQE